MVGQFSHVTCTELMPLVDVGGTWAADWPGGRAASALMTWRRKFGARKGRRGGTGVKESGIKERTQIQELGHATSSPNSPVGRGCPTWMLPERQAPPGPLQNRGGPPEKRAKTKGEEGVMSSAGRPQKKSYNGALGSGRPFPELTWSSAALSRLLRASSFLRQSARTL